MRKKKKQEIIDMLQSKEYDTIANAVCSLSRAEGPEVAAALLAEGFRRSPAPPGFPADCLGPEGDLLTLPHRHGSDGFYATRLVR